MRLIGLTILNLNTNGTVRFHLPFSWMPQTQSRSYIKITFLILALQIFTEASAQELSVRISVDADRRAAQVEGKLRGDNATTPATLSFRGTVTGNEKLAERLSQVLVNRESPGTLSWAYTIHLSPPQERAAAAHASWLAGDGGVLMLDDLLPLFGGDRRRQKARVTLILPKGWQGFSTERSLGNDILDVSNLEGSMVFVGKRFRTVPTRVRSGTLSLLLDGKWTVSDKEAATMAAEIFDAYSSMFGRLPSDRAMVALAKFPQGESPGQWEAETRGATVLIASSDIPFPDRSRIRLHEQLRHEIFHLWFPNAVNLNGDYAWFYEGAALYQSLKLGVALKRIRFADFLDTLSRAITIDRTVAAGPDWQRKFRSEHYARALVAAFLLDLRVLRGSNGEYGAEAVLKEIFREHRPPVPPMDANDAIAARFGRQMFFAENAGAPATYDPSPEITAGGIKVDVRGQTVTLSVASNLSAAQRAILKRLGYN